MYYAYVHETTDILKTPLSTPNTAVSFTVKVVDPCGGNTIHPFVDPPTNTNYEIRVTDPLLNLVHVTPTITSDFPACRMTC